RLMLFVLKKKESAWLYAHGNTELTETQAQEFIRLIEERASGKPLAYILGEWEFYGRPFYVNEHVLIPRPETEELIRQALPHIDVWRGAHPGKQMTIADIGTGSGVIIITLAIELSKFHIPDSKFHFIATDISPKALKVANKNAQRHGVQDQIEFIREDITETLQRNIDLIVSNPPYLPAEALAKAGWAIDTQGLTFEPRMALDGGLDGQEFVQKIVKSNIPAIVETTGGNIQTFNI
ncbi:MAG TPA: peptide chain release factor N(5)-glutamine methyltransferase, partial [Anaerolineales bacterium]|nr:peptide chain release factor N(5)-glutamine methyltransferase [Anaerolineales bacterium]